MKKTGKLCFIVLFMAIITTGCWNLKEPDQQAFVMGTGLDLNADGQYQLSTLIAITAGIGSQEGSGTKKKSFRVLTSIGKNNSDAAQNMQSHLSRSLFVGHREIVLIGQRMAEHGIGELVDDFFRNPQSDVRSRLFVVKGSQAKDVFEIDSFFDPYITTTLYDEQATLGLKNFYIGTLMHDALSQGTQPLLPAVSLNPLKHYDYAGFAILDKENGLKLAGFLDQKEAFYSNWIRRRVNNYVLTSTVPGHQGTFSLKLKFLNRRIRTQVDGQRVKVDVMLTGSGIIVENNTNLDPYKQSNLQLMQKALNEEAQKAIGQLVYKAQKQFKIDIFGFGERIHQQHPEQWKSLRPKWTELFPQIEVTVNVKLKCRDIGQTNSTMFN